MDSAHDSVMDFPSEIMDDLSKDVPSGACPLRDELRAEEPGWTTVRARRPRLHSATSLKTNATEHSPTNATLATSSRFQVTGFDVEEIDDQEDKFATMAFNTSRRLSKKAQQRKRRKQPLKLSPEERKLPIFKAEVQVADPSPAWPPEAETWSVEGETWSPDTETFEENPIVVRHFWGMLLPWIMIAMCLIANISYA